MNQSQYNKAVRTVVKAAQSARKDVVNAGFQKTITLAGQLVSLLQMMVVSDGGYTPELKNAGQLAAKTLQSLKQAHAERERKLRA